MRYRLVQFISIGIVALLALFLWQCGLTICPLRLLTGLPCLGCGMTHAWVACITGDFAQAFQYHPCFLLALPAFLVLLAQPFDWGKKLWHSWLFWMALLLPLLVCYTWRMVKYFPDGQYPMMWAEKSLLSIILNIGQRFSL